MRIYYRKLDGYKYETEVDHVFETGLRPGHDVGNEFIGLSIDGKLSIKAHYCWDGTSGPTIDGPSNMRGSLAHDALYQLMRLGLLPQSFREGADKFFIKVCGEDGMSSVRQSIDYYGLRLFGAKAAALSHKTEEQDEVLVSPS